MAGCLLASSADAAIISGSATGIASPFYTITFSEVALTPEVTQVTNQFVSYGARCSLVATYTPQNGFLNIIGDRIGNFLSFFTSPFTINFASLQSKAAFAIVSNGSDYQFESKLCNNVVKSFTAAVNTSSGNFYGFTRSSFDSIRVTNLKSDFRLIDNVQIGSSVPEPASWALMIVSFGLTGAALRRRHAAAVNA